jgi:hypothetical protein
MKKHFIKSAILLSAVVLFATSCKKLIDEAYQNPNADVRVPVESLMPNLVATMACNHAGHGPINDARYVGQYVGYWHFVNTLSPFDRFGHILSAADVAQSTWRSHYYDIGQNCMRMIQWAEEEKKWDYSGAGKAILAHSWLQLTDYYGDVIFKEAFNTNQITFQFDEQPVVYDGVRKLCFEALNDLNRTGDGVSQANLAKGDAFFYNGDVNKWKKFVYAILARSYNHLTNKNDYKPDSVIKYCDLAMQTNDDNGMVKFANTGISGTANFFGPLRGNLAGASTAAPTAIRQGSYVANLMNGTNPEFSGVQDPRAWYILRGNTNNTIVGVERNRGQAALAANDRPESFWGISQAAGVNNSAPTTDANCRYIFRNDSPMPVITASEIQFMKAEAALIKGDRTTALAAYRRGIELNFDLLTTVYNKAIPAGREITTAVRDAYLAQPSVMPNAAGLTRTKILLQKYIAQYGFGALETWVDMRRYHYTDLDPQTGDQVFRGFVPPTGTDLFEDNGGRSVVYRYRPRFNAEYVWNLNEIKRIGADKNDYHLKECWFSTK